MIFAEWNTAWTLIYKPVTEADINAIEIEPVMHDLFVVILGLLKVKFRKHYDIFGSHR